MWPWWKMKNEDGLYFIKCFAGFNDDPNNKKHLPGGKLTRRTLNDQRHHPNTKHRR